MLKPAKAADFLVLDRVYTPAAVAIHDHFGVKSRTLALGALILSAAFALRADSMTGMAVGVLIYVWQAIIFQNAPSVAPGRMNPYRISYQVLRLSITLITVLLLVTNPINLRLLLDNAAFLSSLYFFSVSDQPRRKRQRQLTLAFNHNH
jgi:hypothetical protein